MILKSWAENLKYLWRSYKEFGMHNMWAEYSKKKSTRSSQSCSFGKILQCWKNLGMFPSSRFWDIIFFNSVLHLCLPPCVLQRGRHHHIKARRNMWSKNLDDGNDNIYFCLKIWLFGGWAETSLNQFEQELSKITLNGNWNCSAPIIGT